jgi:hypothetical protein
VRPREALFRPPGSREAFRLPPLASIDCMSGRRMLVLSALFLLRQDYSWYTEHLYLTDERKLQSSILNVIFLQRHTLSANQIRQSVILLFYHFASFFQTHQFFLNIFFRHNNIPLNRHYRSKMYTSSFLLVALMVPHVSEAFATLPSVGHNSRFGLKSSVRYFLNTQWNLARIDHVEESCNMSKQ